jgi:hypothetical protein
VRSQVRGQKAKAKGQNDGEERKPEDESGGVRSQVKGQRSKGKSQKAKPQAGAEVGRRKSERSQASARADGLVEVCHTEEGRGDGTEHIAVE